MTPPAAPLAEDQALADRIAALMRVGTALASALLVAGVVLGSAQAAGAATILLGGGGCGLLVLLPVLRLVLMARHFLRHTEWSFAMITLAVLTLVIAAAAVGIVT